MRIKRIVQNTTNRGEFNRAYKYYLDTVGKIHCDRCKYNRGENFKGKHYGGREDEIKYPNWKLASKNPKQWMEKPLKIKTEKLRYSYKTIDPSGNIKEYKTFTTIKLKWEK